MKDKDQETLKKIKLERLIKTRGSKNRGARYERINENKRHNYNDTEEAFYDEWIKQSRHLSTLISPRDPDMKIKVTTRDRIVAASIVQWMGTNCGMGFLHAVLARCGKEIVKKNTTIQTSVVAKRYGL